MVLFLLVALTGGGASMRAERYSTAQEPQVASRCGSARTECPTVDYGATARARSDATTAGRGRGLDMTRPPWASQKRAVSPSANCSTAKRMAYSGSGLRCVPSRAPDRGEMESNPAEQVLDSARRAGVPLAQPGNVEQLTISLAIAMVGLVSAAGVGIAMPTSISRILRGCQHSVVQALVPPDNTVMAVPTPGQLLSLEALAATVRDGERQNANRDGAGVSASDPAPVPPAEGTGSQTVAGQSSAIAPATAPAPCGEEASEAERDSSHACDESPVNAISEEDTGSAGREPKPGK